MAATHEITVVNKFSASGIIQVQSPGDHILDLGFKPSHIHMLNVSLYEDDSFDSVVWYQGMSYALLLSIVQQGNDLYVPLNGAISHFDGDESTKSGLLFTEAIFLSPFTWRFTAYR